MSSSSGRSRPDRPDRPVPTPRWAGRVAALTLGALVGAAAFALPHFVGGRPSDLAGDYWVFYSAARVVAHGGDPYRQAVLTLAERRVWPGVPPPPANANFAYLPIVAWALGPLARLPFWPSFWLVTAIDAGLTLVAIRAIARRLGWTHPWVPAWIALALWVSLAGLLLGQPDGLLLAALAAAILLRIDGRGLAAGLLLTLSWIKPQLLLPAAPLLALGCWPDRRLAVRVLAGFAAGTAGGLGVQLVATPGLLPDWWRYLHTFAAAVPRVQVDLAGAVGLLGDLPAAAHAADLAARWPAAAVAVGGALAALAVGLVLARRRGRGAAVPPDERVIAVMAPLAVWLVATPYDHAEDLVLLTPLVLVLLGAGAGRLGQVGAWAPAGLLATLPYVEALRAGVPDLAPLVVIAVAGAGLLGAVGDRRPARLRLPAVGTIGDNGPAPARGPAP